MAKKTVTFTAKRQSGKGNSRLKEIYSLGEVMEVPLDQWRRDETQPRPLEEVLDGIEEFADQLERDNFKLAQLPVYHIENDGTYLNIVGERRTTAFKMKGRKTIPAVCRKFTEEERREIFLLQYIENDDKEKKPLSPLADARAWERLINDYYGGNMSEAAKQRGRAKADVSNRLALLKAPEVVVKFVQENEIRDPATFAAMNRLHKHSANKLSEVLAAYKAGEVTGSLRAKVETEAKQFSKKQKGLSLIAPDAFGGGKSGNEEKNNTLDLEGKSALPEELDVFIKVAKQGKGLAKVSDNKAMAEWLETTVKQHLENTIRYYKKAQ